MAYIKREFYTKDLEIQKYVDSLMKNRFVSLPPKRAQDIGRNKTIRNIRNIDRKNPYILIGLDREHKKSIITIRDPVKIVKVGDKYVFSL